jgi:ATP-binding cassette, subfamily B, bacterial
MLEGYRLKYLGANISLGLGALAQTGTYLLLRYFIDTLILKGERMDLLPLIALSFIGIALIQGLFSFISGRLAAMTAEGITRRLRNYVFDHIQRLNFVYHDKTPTGELIQRSTSDIDALRRFFADQAIGAGRILFLFAVNMAVLLTLNVRLALFSVIVVPFVIVLSIFFFKRVSKAYEEYQEQEAKLSTTLQENLAGVRVVKAFARQEFERQKFEGENWSKYVKGRRFMYMHSLYWPFSDILSGAQMLAGFTLGAIMTIEGTISIGTYLAYAGMVIWIIWPMRNLGRMIVQMSTGLVSLKRITDVIKEPRENMEAGKAAPTGKVKGNFTFDQVYFGYDTDIPVLENISFECKAGQRIALLGPTGSGKTTLINLLPRFYEYSRGSIKLDGIELRDYPRRYLREMIGIVEQEPFLFSRTIRENITYSLMEEPTEAEVYSAAKAAAIHDVILAFPDGYETLVGEKGVTLSGGQKQRVAIARTLIKDPRILILDDSTSSVDTETESIIRSAFERLMQDRTSFIIAHRIQSVQDADLILVLDKGKIVQMGDHQSLMQEKGIYRNVFDLQTRIEVELEKEIARV